MNILTLVPVFLTLGFVSLGLLLSYRQRNRQRRRAAINQEPPAKDETYALEDLAYVNNFYCFRLRVGSCRSGLIMDPPKQTPDIRTSESRLDDG